MVSITTERSFLVKLKPWLTLVLLNQVSKEEGNFHWGDDRLWEDCVWSWVPVPYPLKRGNQCYVCTSPIREGYFLLFSAAWLHYSCYLLRRKHWTSMLIEKEIIAGKYSSYSQSWFRRGSWGVRLRRAKCSHTDGTECSLLACSLPLLTARRLIAPRLLAAC